MISLARKAARSYSEQGFWVTNRAIARWLRARRKPAAVADPEPSPSHIDEPSVAAGVPPDPGSALRTHLGLTPDPGFAERRTAERFTVIDRLAGCSPGNASPAEMEGYLQEAALRFHDTVAWAERVLERSPGRPAPRVLETGSNPYFLTILLEERLEPLEHLGINYFGDESQLGETHTEAIIDPKGSVTETSFLYADVERTPLGDLEPVDLCLFCEVIEHLPFDPAWALFNLASTLRPGGSLILTTPNPARWENVERLALHTGSKDDPISAYGLHGRHNREYTAGELTELLTETGLSILHQSTFDVFPNEWSASAERLGYGAYHLLVGALTSGPVLYRPEWLYRSFEPSVLQQRGPLPRVV